jgi:hypothetical protein
MSVPRHVRSAAAVSIASTEVPDIMPITIIRFLLFHDRQSAKGSDRDPQAPRFSAYDSKPSLPQAIVVSE